LESDGTKASAHAAHQSNDWKRDDAAIISLFEVLPCLAQCMQAIKGGDAGRNQP
jgi:formylmethanofuran dehydrogenase subunit E